MPMTKVSQFLSDQMRSSGKTQKQIAKEAGFPSPNILSMIKTGETRMPIARVPTMAKALDISPHDLLRRCLAEYDPEVLGVIESLRPIALLSDAEIELVRALRSLLASATS